MGILRSSQSRTRCRVTRYFRLLQTLVDRGKLFLKSERLGQIFCRLRFFCFALLCISYCVQYLYLLLLLSLLSLSLLLATFTSNISFDVVMCFYFFSCIYVLSSSFAFCLPLFISFCLMELRRTPYDLLERESELVSRYNIEYRGFGFTLLFLGEYSRFFWILGLLSLIFGLRLFIGLFVFTGLVTI